MNKRFYPRLALDNIRKNRRTYLPYALTCTGTIAMFYIIYALSQNSGIENIIGSSTIQVVLSLGNFVVGLFAVIFLFYTNSFLIKRRKKEFGLYNILGMEKRHIAKVIGYETLFLSLGSLAVGLLAGLLLSKLAFLAVLKLLDFEVVMGFEVSPPAIRATLLLFGFTFHTASPIELLRGGQTGEREPKTKWLLTLAGLGCTGGGYAIALTITDPLSALTLFFLAVILVIVGTYCLFTAGSIALLKLLRKNKRFYYESRHFISVSSLLYRMKQNAAGLANICVLSTMVLVMISSTSSLYIGMEEVIQKRYPRDFTPTRINLPTRFPAISAPYFSSPRRIMVPSADSRFPSGRMRCCSSVDARRMHTTPYACSTGRLSSASGWIAFRKTACRSPAWSTPIISSCRTAPRLRTYTGSRRRFMERTALMSSITAASICP